MEDIVVGAARVSLWQRFSDQEDEKPADDENVKLVSGKGQNGIKNSRSPRTAVFPEIRARWNFADSSASPRSTFSRVGAPRDQLCGKARFVFQSVIMTAGEMNQNPLLTLDALGACGCVLPTEVQAAMDVSLTLKARELGVRAFLFWGRLCTESGADYYVARAHNGAKDLDGAIVPNPGNKFYYSRDGVNWLDLEPVSSETTARALKITCWLTGDPAHVFHVAQPVPELEPKPEPVEGEEPTPDEEAEPLPPWEITEAEYMMCRINAIHGSCDLAPEGMFITDPHGNISVNPMFCVERPDQPSAYATSCGSLANAAPGKWGVAFDTFKRQTTIRNFEYPGFFAYYSHVSNTVGNLYFGDGLRNADLAFTV